MKRTISEFLVLVCTILLLAVWYACGLPAARPAVPHPFLSGLLACLVILADAALLYLTEDRILAQMGLFAPVSYIVLVTANPNALWFSPFHVAALLLTLSIVFFLYFCAIRPGMGSLIGAWTTLGTSALLFPPFLWLAPVYAVSAVGKAEDKWKFWVASLLSVCLPLGIQTAVTGLQDNTGWSAASLTELWRGMTTVSSVSLHFSAATLCRISLTALATLLAILWSIGRLDRYKISRSAAVIRIMLLTLALSILMLVFLPDNRHPSGLVTALPVSLLLNEYFTAPDRKRGSRTLALILILILIAERISCYV